MIVNTTRILRRWLEHPLYGINALLPDVPRARVDGVIDTVPPSVAFYDDIDDDEVAEGIKPPITPAMVLYCDAPARVDIDQRNYLKGEAPLVFAGAYVTENLPESVAARYGGYTARAFRRSLYLFNKQELSVTPELDYRTLNGIKVMKVGLVTEQRVATDAGQSSLWGFVLASVTVVDTLA